MDLFFHYKNVCRNLLLNRYFNLEYNTYQIWKINYLIIYFSLNNIENTEDISSMNYAFLFRFFFGRKSFISNFKTVFHRGIVYSSFIVQSLIKKKDLYFVLFFYINDIKPFVSKEFIQIKKKNNFFQITITDTTLFMEKKNNVGLFNLIDFLNLRVSNTFYGYIKENSLDIFKI